MKVTPEVYQKMKSDIKVILNIYFPYAETIPFEFFRISDLHEIWFKVYANRKYEDSHPMVQKKNGKRVLKLDESFEMYPCDTNDNSLQTALIKLFKELTSS
jgi:hypothetical protein